MIEIRQCRTTLKEAMLLPILLTLLSVAEDLPAPKYIVELQTELDHVQGIDVEANRLWVSEVQRKEKRGRVHKFELSSGKLLRTADVTRGVQYHPGGITLDKNSLWVPVAEYRPKSSSTILRLDKSSLEVEETLDIADHIGAIAIGPQLWGANWDARQIYDLRTKTPRDNVGGTGYQDLKFSRGLLVGGGLRGKTEFVIDWLDPGTLKLVRRIIAGRTDRGVPYTQEGMTIKGDRLYLLPEDGRSRLFVFDLPPMNTR
ncbi:MAG: DUF6454 family protein [Acidobacteria bacterium]|nr:DUF6454 family protein [Acidobacteriota bacterium]